MTKKLAVQPIKHTYRTPLSDAKDQKGCHWCGCLEDAHPTDNDMHEIREQAAFQQFEDSDEIRAVTQRIAKL